MDADQVEQLYMNARAVGALDRHVGARLRTRRIMLQMSEVWLADALGLSFGELTAMEAGTLKIGPRRLAFIAVALDVADRYFFMDFNPTMGEGERRPGWVREVDCWFRDCVSPHEGLFLTVAKRLVGSHSAARDLVHDAYTQLMVDDRWRTIDNPKAYVRQSVLNLARNFVAKHRVAPLARLEPGMGGGDVEDEAPGPGAFAADRDHLRRVLMAISKLPPKSRRVMVMRKIDGLSGNEIAKRMGISLKGVEIHLTRGMVALNKLLEADDVGKGLAAIVSDKENAPNSSISD
ncbi:sigma-70 family RNA polymerase sigma factor [Asticcacaulis taihuensis]|uniref:RNA polymerase sigma-70 factor, ECF subfamily n=1 Tax=Asticcacaulis taihuensis TaxID=260084 RepID=A0A1G4PV84_9CAUL|nr:sigma-70 family RNA polymerase sigma factor [Asticcacaulis taihuensis]SCW36176.1 RNA polymerase sigma-70 factor, ECF subfamily [Asticcacaulis taihuensis]